MKSVFKKWVVTLSLILIAVIGATLFFTVEADYSGTEVEVGINYVLNIRPFCPRPHRFPE